MKISQNEKEKIITMNFEGAYEMAEYASKWEGSKGDNVQFMKSREFFIKSDFNDNHLPNDVLKEMSMPSLKLGGIIECAENVELGNFGLTENVRRRRRVRGLCDGGEIDIDKYYNREYDTMWSDMRIENKQERIIKLYVNISVHYKWTDENFKWRTSTILKIAQILEELKMPCEIIGVSQSGNVTKNGYGVRQLFPVKKCEQLLDPETVAYVLGSQAFFRSSCLTARIMGLDTLNKENGTDYKVRYELGFSQSYSGNEKAFYAVNCSTKREGENEIKRFVEWLKKEKEGGND